MQFEYKSFGNLPPTSMRAIIAQDICLCHGVQKRAEEQLFSAWSFGVLYLKGLLQECLRFSTRVGWNRRADLRPADLEDGLEL